MEIVLLGLCVTIIIMMVIIVIVLMNQKSKQEMMIRNVLLESENAKIKEMQLLKDQIEIEIGSVKEKVTSDLIGFQYQMTSTMRNDFNQLNESTTTRLTSIENRVNRSLLDGFEKTNKSFTSMIEQLARIDETQNSLKSLSNEIVSLQNILNDKKSRGTFGEVELYSILENAFGQNKQQYDKQVKLSNGCIADAVIYASEPLGKIVIDSKFPLENYSRIYQMELSNDERNRASVEFKKDVIKHLKDIHNKYLIKGETAEIAYMFIPAEAVFAEIYGKHEDIVQLSYNLRVYLVSPTTLMAYITAIKAIYLGQLRNEKVEEIQREFVKLSEEFRRFSTRWEIVVKDFNRTYSDIESVNTTTNKLIKQFNKIEAVELTDNSEKSVE